MKKKKKMPDVPYEFYSKVSGVTFQNSDGSDRQKLIRAYCKVGVPLVLWREPKNPYGANAIGVWVEVRGFLTPTKMMQIGYITSRAAEELAPIMDQGGKVRARITAITGGMQNESVGVNIEIQVEPPRLPTEQPPKAVG